eukprot:scaffold72689_cov28-Tisochrysis_lutea.AAC.1
MTAGLCMHHPIFDTRIGGKVRSACGRDSLMWPTCGGEALQSNHAHFCVLDVLSWRARLRRLTSTPPLGCPSSIEMSGPGVGACDAFTAIMHDAHANHVVSKMSLCAG